MGSSEGLCCLEISPSPSLGMRIVTRPCWSWWQETSSPTVTASLSTAPGEMKLRDWRHCCARSSRRRTLREQRGRRRRAATPRLATLLRTKLQEKDIKGAERKKEKGRYSETAEPYHAGLTAHRRKSVQARFMTGKLRVVVATVAFGMGIDKSDIRAIVHYNMPKTFESYIQEIGRAGRDGKPARCHLFLENNGRDLSELRRHIFSNSVDRHSVRKLLQSIFSVGGAEEEALVGRRRRYREEAVAGRRR